MTALHVVNLVAHAAAAVLVFSCPGGFSRWLHLSVWRRRCRSLAALAAPVVRTAPLRVEVVAWVSSMSYAVSLALAPQRLSGPRRRTARTDAAALGLYAVSLLVRPAALGLPVVLVLVDRFMLGREFVQACRRRPPSP
ncbi:MAG: hypothetical protein R2712_04310 [Vicinamibacterales bacterium]